MTTLKRRTWFAAAGLFVVGMLALALRLWHSPVDATTGSSARLPEPRLAAFQLYASALIVATDRSALIEPGHECWSAARVRPTILKRSKGPEIVDALVGGSADFGTLAITPVVLQILQGSDLVIFATIQVSDSDIKVVGRRTAGIVSGGTLRGKRVGYVGGTYGEIFLDRYLKKYNLDRAAVTPVSGGPAQLRDQFLGGALDAAVVWEPTIQDILLDPATKKDDLFIDTDRSLYTGRINLAAKPEILRTKRDAAVGLVRALVCGEGVLERHPDKTREQLEAWLDRRVGSLVGVFNETAFRVGLDLPALIRDLRTESEWAQKAVLNGKGRIPEVFSRHVDSSILMAVDGHRVVR